MATQKSISYQAATDNKRVEATITREITAHPRRIFPMACPVEELRWIPDWEYELVYSKSGVNEVDCVFFEKVSGPHFFGEAFNTCWTTIVHDPENYRVVFILNPNNKAVIRLNVTIRQVTQEVSNCTWHLVFTALDNDANGMSENEIKEKMELMITFLADLLVQYFKNEGVDG